MDNMSNTTIEIQSGINNETTTGRVVFKTENGNLTSAQKEILQIYNDILPVTILNTNESAHKNLMVPEKLASKKPVKRLNKTHRTPNSPGSLGSLTTTLLKIIPEGGCINTNLAAKSLNVHKRSMYQVINVLKSVDVISQAGIGLFKWAETESGRCYKSFIKKMKLRETIAQLEEKEKKLDALIKSVEKENRRILHQNQYAYLSVDDIQAIPQLVDDTFLLFKAPPKTTATVSPDFTKMHIKATLGEIQMFLGIDTDDTN